VAAVGIPLGVFLLVLGGVLYAAAALALALLGLHEFYSLVRPYRPNLLVGYLAAVGVVAGTWLAGLTGLLAGLAAVPLLLFLWGTGGRIGHHLVGRMAVTILGTVWVAVGFGYLVLLRELEHGAALVLIPLGGAWAADTLAYATGRLIGRHRLAPRISPKKTVEGAVGAVVGAVLFTLAVKIYSPWLPVGPAALLGVIVGVSGLMGDLFESLVKRDLHVKDSGTLLAGHGGVLDRFDSVLFTGVAVYWGVVVLLRDVIEGLPG
jgi:phosphatidate cytidylyltransferase